MTVTPVKSYSDREGTWVRWQIHGELNLEVREAAQETYVALGQVRDPAWRKPAWELLTATARELGIFRRQEGLIDGLTVVVDRHGAGALITRMAEHRFGTKDYSTLTERDALRAVLARIEAAGTLPGEAIDDSVVIESFPLGYHLRDAMAELQRLGAVELTRRKGQTPLLRVNAASRVILDG